MLDPRKMTVTASSVDPNWGGPPEVALDGINSHFDSAIEHRHMTHSATFDYLPWVQLDLGSSTTIKMASYPFLDCFPYFNCLHAPGIKYRKVLFLKFH